MSSVHCVVVWEWQQDGYWLPHSSAVTRTIERAHGKSLTRVVLADADPTLKGHYVNLMTLIQYYDSTDGESSECRVRRRCYSVQSVAGRGVRWEWASFVSPPRPAELTYEPLPLEVAGEVEIAWSREDPRPVVHAGWAINVIQLMAHCTGGSFRLVRRVSVQPYPLTRPPPPALLPRQRHQHLTECRGSRIPQQHTGSSVQSVQSTHSSNLVTKVTDMENAVSAARERKPGLARQILHNLNIFSTNSTKPMSLSQESCEEAERGHTDTECSSTRSNRRHSVDTISTYLSQDSEQRGSVGELLNCSAGSDDVFDTPSSNIPETRKHPPITGDVEHLNRTQSTPAPIDGNWYTTPTENVDKARVASAVGAGSVGRAAWGALCPTCCTAITNGASTVERQRPQIQRDLLNPHSIECLLCGQVYGARNAKYGERMEHIERKGVKELKQAHERHEGEQPAGSMAWCVQPAPLPGQPPNTGSILVTYNFQSGRQGPNHPAPGAPYYAVGFPRHSLLPDTPIGRQVLSVLRACWERGLLFQVAVSQTTGREHVVSWRLPPPPQSRAHYHPGADRQLSETLQHARRLLTTGTASASGGLHHPHY